MSDSLILAGQIELLGDGVASQIPACAGATFYLDDGHDLGAFQPQQDYIASLLLDGERPFGRRSGNRTITLPINIEAPDRQTLAAAREVLTQAIDAQTWSLQWIRDNYTPYPQAAPPTIVTNGTFETNVTGWTAQNGGTFAQSNTQVHGGSFAGRLTPNGTTANPQVITAAVACKPGQGAGISGFVYTTSAQTVTIDVQFQDSTGTAIPGADVIDTVAGTNSFQQFSAGGVAPAGTAKVVAFIQMTGTPANTLLMYVDDVTNWAISDVVSSLALPLIFDCYRALPTTMDYDITDDQQYHGAMSIQFQARPFGRTDMPVTVPVASPLTGGPAPATPITLDTFTSVSGTSWEQSTFCVIGPKSARFNPCLAPIGDCTGNNSFPAAYSHSFGSNLNLTGLVNLTGYFGFSTGYYSTWSGGPVVFQWKLTDSNNKVLSFSVTKSVSASNDNNNPRWIKITAAIPQNKSGFLYSSVKSYSVSISNRGYNGFRYGKVLMDHLVANPPSLQTLASVRGLVYSVPGVQGTARTPLALQATQAVGTGASTTLALPGQVGTPQTFGPVPSGVSTLNVRGVGPGGRGGNSTAAAGAGGGGGSGEDAQETALAVTAGGFYPYLLGANGTGVATTFAGDSVTVTAHAGGNGGDVTSGSGAAGIAGSGSLNSIHHSGAAGSAGVAGTSTGAGASSGGTSAAGNAASGITGGAAVTGGGRGANGSTGNGPGANGGQPGGGGAGGRWSGAPGSGAGGKGGDGYLEVTYTLPTALFSTLLVHKPGPDSPMNLVPIVSFGTAVTADNTTEYPIPSDQTGVYADLNGTYTILLVANSWNSPSSSRDLTVKIRQYEYQGGPSYTKSVTRTVTPSTDIVNGFVVMGELTLPTKDVAQDNSGGLYTMIINDSNSSDTFMDCMLLDTMGETVFINEATAQAYNTFFIDTPQSDRDLGRIMGSDFDRAQAISVMDSTTISGGPLYLDPGDNVLLCYCVEGAPSLSLTYYPFWYWDRLY